MTGGGKANALRLNQHDRVPALLPFGQRLPTRFGRRRFLPPFFGIDSLVFPTFLNAQNALLTQPIYIPATTYHPNFSYALQYNVNLEREIAFPKAQVTIVNQSTGSKRDTVTDMAVSMISPACQPETMLFAQRKKDSEPRFEKKIQSLPNPAAHNLRQSERLKYLDLISHCLVHIG